MELNKLFDHTFLSQNAQRKDIEKICIEAREYKFFSVCISPLWVKTAKELLKNSDVKVCTVIGFPHGTQTAQVKAFETADAIQNGADEVDTVISVGRLKDGDFDYVYEDIKAVVDAAKGKALVKVIIETCLLTDEEKVKACELAKKAGADFVKTSTGFSTAGATIADVALMRQTVGPDMGVKASGGIGTKNDAIAMVEAGATRLGVSRSLKILGED